MHLNILRMFLGCAAFAWGVSVVAIFLSWGTVEQALRGMGAKTLTYDRMLDYWLRMTATAFGFIGCLFLVLMIWPRKFHAAIPWFGGFMLVQGVVLLVHGLRLDLPPFPFYGDTAACLVSGAAILYLARYARPNHPAGIVAR